MEDLIYEIRGKQVMLDSDLARLYKCVNGAKTINQAVRRNSERFPEEFMFQLTKEEYMQLLRFQIGTANDDGGENLRSQFGTSSLRFQTETANNRGSEILRSQIVTAKVTSDENLEYGGRRYLPYVFTEQGVAMLASVLRTKTAVETSIKIINAFVAMRRYISNDLVEQKYVNKMVFDDHERINVLEETLDKFEKDRVGTEIYFDGQIYDAYSKIFEVFQMAKKELIVIDSYADKTLLDMFRRLNVKVLLVTKKGGLLTKQDEESYRKQYKNLEVIRDDSFHDRYFIIDNLIVYHCGASVNRIGHKTFSITRVGDDGVRELLISKLEKLTK